MSGSRPLRPEDRAAIARLFDDAVRMLHRSGVVPDHVDDADLHALVVEAVDSVNPAAARAYDAYAYLREHAERGRLRRAMAEAAPRLDEVYGEGWTRSTLREHTGPHPPSEQRLAEQVVPAARARWEQDLLILGLLPLLIPVFRLPEALADMDFASDRAAPPGSPGAAPGGPPRPQPAWDAAPYPEPDARPDVTWHGGTSNTGIVRPTEPTDPPTPVTPYGSPPAQAVSPRTVPQPQPQPPPPDPRRMVVELVDQAPPGTHVPLHVQFVRDGPDRTDGVPLRAFAVPPEGARLLVTVYAPGLTVLGDLQQEVTVRPGADSDVLRFGLRTTAPGLRTVTVRAFHRGTFLGEVRAQVSVGTGAPVRDGPPRTAALGTVAFDPGEVTLQVLRGADGSYSFQLIGETCYAPESFRTLGGDPRLISERVYRELRQAAADAGPGGADGAAGTRRLRNLGVELWASAVPEAVRRQFWAEADRVTSVTVLGEHDLVPWELLYPLDGPSEGPGFLAEWLPVVRRTFGQQRVRRLALPQVTFVVPPGSPPEAAREVETVRHLFDAAATGARVLDDRASVAALVEDGYRGLLHFACHNAFTTERGSVVTMADGPFDPVDLAYATHAGTLRESGPMVFFNACRSAGQIDWFASTLGWAPQFLRAGAGAFVGTLWPVRSDAAQDFARAFYTHFLGHGRPLGEASLHARRALRRGDGDPTWLAYAVYGSPAARADPPGDRERGPVSPEGVR
ncbi:CHAT domain-containing protein [Streptomyces sp. NPDC127068]|uniref:CHAT domain-containing protein n=1 Tax=Streptomyces sp. NPDC127068 TaxID=3347127 RepID=UPI003651502D